MIYHADCLDAMAEMEPESVDAIVTDPPYGLEFMGKEWDRLWTDQGGKTWANGNHGSLRAPAYKAGFAAQEWHARWAEAAYRVAKPSAYLLAFGGTRTVHRMTVALEDAGWIIRDMLVWGYASGFPKSKASLKPAWEPIVMARKPGPLRMLAIDECRIPMSSEDAEVIASAGGFMRAGWQGPDTGIYNKSGDVTVGATIQSGRWPANIVLTDPIFDGGIAGVVGGGDARAAGEFPTTYSNGRGYGGEIGSVQGPLYGDTGTYSRFFLVPKSARSDREPVLDEYAYRLHRERGECDKLGAWGNADRSRSEPTGSMSPARATSEDAPTMDGSVSGTSSRGKLPTAPSPTASKSTTSTATSGTTPSTTSSSLIPSHTSDSTRGANSETASGGSPAASVESSSLWEPPTGISVVKGGRSTDDAAPATSASWSSRNVCGRCGKPLPRVGSHPTVKPTDLMRHSCAS